MFRKELDTIDRELQNLKEIRENIHTKMQFITHAQSLESAKTENEIYKETAFGKYTGFYSYYDGIYGYILLDDSDETFNVFVIFSVYPFDESAANGDYLSIYESPQVQNILNNIEFESSN